jgi:hypothetical protein
MKKRKPQRTTTDALEIIHRRYYANRPERSAELQQAIDWVRVFAPLALRSDAGV